MTLNNYQVSYRGVVMGDGTNYDFIELNGIHDMIVKDRDRDNPRTHGMIPGVHSATFRLIRASLEVRGVAGSSAHQRDIQALLSAMSPDAHQSPDETDDQFTFKFPGESERFMFARPVRRSRPRRVSSEFGLAPIRFELKVYDPRQYSTFEDNSGSQTADFTVISGGDAQAFPIIEFGVDTLGGMFIRNNTNDSVFSIAGLPINSNDYVADMGRWNRGRGDLLIIYKGATNHYDKWGIPRDPFYLDPGTNELDLTVSANAEVTIRSRDTWM